MCRSRHGPPAGSTDKSSIVDRIVQSSEYWCQPGNVHGGPTKRLFLEDALQIPRAGFHASPVHCAPKSSDPVSRAFLTIGFPYFVAIAYRIGRYLERQGLLVRDAEQSYLTLDEPEEDSMNQLQGYSITYRITVDPHQGRKVFTLQTLPGTEGPSIDAADRGGRFFAARQFSQHASVAVKVSERKKLEQISGGGPAAASADRRCPKNDFH